METSDIIWEVKKDAIRRLILSGKRADDRAFDEYRPIELKPEYIMRAEGSCLARLGNTVVLAGVKCELAEPYPDSPEDGVMMTNAELVPMASPTFMAGPPDENSIELARVVDRGIRESKMIDTKKLCIEPKKKVWNILIDLHVLDYDGNLIDAAELAACRALLTARFPKLEDETVTYGVKMDPIPVRDKPVYCSFSKIGNMIILDPTLEEEKVTDAKLMLATNQDGNVCATQKSGTGSFTAKEIDELIEVAVRKGKELRSKFLEI
jgi:exosome complex component RRP42